MFFWNTTDTNRRSSGGFSGTANTRENGVCWVRAPFALALFITVCWGMSLLPFVDSLLTSWPGAFGRLILITAFVLGFYGLMIVRDDDLLESPPGLAVYGTLILATVAVSGGLIYGENTAYYVPVTLFTMLVAVGFSTVLAIESYFFMLFLVMATWIPSGESFLTASRVSTSATSNVLFVLSFTTMAPGAIVAALLCQSIRKRTRPLSAGLAAGSLHVFLFAGMCMLLYSGLDLFSDPTHRSTLYHHSLVAFGNGFLSGGLLVVILPLIEKLFGIPTDLGLLELTDMNQPALRKLAMEAPGTYHHSLRVGTLCEEAAEAIGANPLLARVGSYYHDIGKTTKPRYFIENSRGGENPHDRLPSNMSKLILIGHVRDGIELADQYGLPAWIKDFIEQHHGTSVTEYFFAKQVQSQLEKGEEPNVETADFRYPGPLPSTREIGICMLADSVEATSRSLEDPSPTQIEGMVERVIEKKIEDGQLDESGLTLGDVRSIRRSFVEVLSGMLHNRIKYPDQNEQAPSDLSAPPPEPDDQADTKEPDEPTSETTDGSSPDEEIDSTPASESPTTVRQDPPDTSIQNTPEPPASDYQTGRRTFILNHQNDLDISEERVRELVHFVMDAEQCNSDTSIVLLKKAEIKSLNRQYLDEERPTDVLAFPLQEQDSSADVDDLLGEVMVCPAVARSKAAEHGHPPKHEMYLYLIHGLLHLLGYDDKTEEDAEKMSTRQEELLDTFLNQKVPAETRGTT